MAGALGRWGDESELTLLLNLVRSLYAHAEKVGGGLTAYLNLRSYPAFLVFTAYALGLTRAERWGTLHRLFSVVIDRQYKDPVRSIESLFLWAWKGTENDVWKQVEGLADKKTPLSEHLLALFREWGKSFAGLVPDFELMFERFELLGSLAHLERSEKDFVKAELAGNPQQAWAWMPVGRVGWHSSNAERLLSEIQAEPMKTALIKAGFAKGDPEFLDVFVQNFIRIAGRMRW